MLDDPDLAAPGTGPRLDDSRLMFAFAHDVRAHLRTVLTRIQLVQRGGGAALPEDDQALLQEAASAAGDIGGLLNAMASYLDAGSLEGQSANAGKDAQDLGLLLQGVLLERKAALREAGAEVEVSNGVKATVPAELRNVLKELLTNSCKFREADRPLRIRVAVEVTATDRIAITVSDNGIGVPAEYLGRIFTPFQRLHSRDEFPGHALGLATCRRVLVRLGGVIAAESQPDHGLTIRLALPLASTP